MGGNRIAPDYDIATQGVPILSCILRVIGAPERVRADLSGSDRGLIDGSLFPALGLQFLELVAAAPALDQKVCSHLGAVDDLFGDDEFVADLFIQRRVEIERAA